MGLNELNELNDEWTAEAIMDRYAGYGGGWQWVDCPSCREGMAPQRDPMDRGRKCPICHGEGLVKIMPKSRMELTC